MQDSQNLNPLQPMLCNSPTGNYQQEPALSFQHRNDDSAKQQSTHKVFISYIFISYIFISSTLKASFLKDNCIAQLDSSNLAPNQLLFHSYHKLLNIIQQLQFRIRKKMHYYTFFLVHFLSLIIATEGVNASNSIKF